MARTVRDSKLETRTARDRLGTQIKPHWRTIVPGSLHLGYRRRRCGTPGVWIVRRYVGTDAGGAGRYRETTLGIADDYQDPDGTTVLSYADAQRLALDRPATIPQLAETGIAATASGLTVRDAMTAYLKHLDHRGQSTVDTRCRSEAFIIPTLGDLVINDLDSTRLREWHSNLTRLAPRLRTRKGKPQRHRPLLDDEQSRRRRKSTANRTLTVLKAALNLAFANNERQITSDRAWAAVTPFEGVDAARVRYLTADEVRRLINACGRDLRALVQAGLETGARYNELARLEVMDFNQDVGTVTIRQSKSQRFRHIILTQEGVGFFAGLCAGRPGDELVLQHDGNAWKASHQIRPIAEVAKRAKIAGFSFHVLRHTWASHAVMNGVPLMVVAKNMGHSDTRMVEKHYGHLAPSFMVDAIRAGAPRWGASAGNVVPVKLIR